MMKLTVGAVARRASISRSTLRYYEQIGILRAAERIGGRRRYDLSVLKQLRFISFAKQAGFTLTEIRALQQQASRGKALGGLWRDLVASKAAELGAILLHVSQAQSRLTTLARCQCGNLAECVEHLSQKEVSSEFKKLL